MARIVKSCALDAETDAIASDLPNFSYWVRVELRNLRDQQLIESGAPMELHHRPDEQFGGVCNGMKRPTCRKCYPNGPPSQTDWLSYVLNYREKRIEQPEAFAELLATIPKKWTRNTGPSDTQSVKINAGELISSADSTERIQKAAGRGLWGRLRSLLPFLLLDSSVPLHGRRGRR